MLIMSIRLRTTFCFMIVLNLLASVSVFGVPLPWVGMALGVTVAPIFVSRVKGLWATLFLPLILFLTYLVVLNIVYWHHFSDFHPSAATTPYPVYVFLRYMAILNFVAIVVIVLRICQKGGDGWVINSIVNFGVIVASYAIYVYFAQIFGLPELLPRSRLGTGGEEQATTFTYAFHRAMGSFREPSHLAEWLMVPFTLSFITNLKYFDPRKILIGVAILMTGSMTGIVSLLMALPIAFGLTYGRGGGLSWTVIKKSFVVVVLFVLLISVVNIGLAGLLFEVIFDRLLEVLEGGMSASNRGYVYDYVAGASIPFFGVGAGNGNIEFSLATENELVSSFLSLYLNVLYSSGLFGIVVFFGVLGFPVFMAFASLGEEHRQTGFFILWGYIAWLISFSVHSEELTSMFGVSYALLFFYTVKTRSKKRPASERLLTRQSNMLHIKSI